MHDATMQIYKPTVFYIKFWAFWYKERNFWTSKTPDMDFTSLGYILNFPNSWKRSPADWVDPCDLVLVCANVQLMLLPHGGVWFARTSSPNDPNLHLWSLIQQSERKKSWTYLYSPEKTTATTNCSLLAIVDDVLMFLQTWRWQESAEVTTAN